MLLDRASQSISPDSLSPIKQGEDLSQTFIRLALAYQKAALDAGKQITAFRDPHLPHFNARTASERESILRTLQFCVNVFEGTQAQGHSMKDSPAVIWQALRQFGLRPPSDLFSRITSESIVEIHSPDGVQMFRNFNFYKLCSYSIEELYCIPWHVLFCWGEDFSQLVGNLARRVYMGEITSTTATGLPPHFVTEALSPAKNRARLRMEWIAPLYREGTPHPAATIVIESGELVGRVTQAADLNANPAPF